MKKQITKKAGMLLTLLLVLTMLFVLCSCGSSKKVTNENNTEKTISEASEQETSEDKDEEPVDKIDLDGLSEIESKDKSKVKITKKEVQEDAVSGFTMRGGDALNLTVSNDSNSDVTEFTIYIVGYDEKDGLTEVQPSMSVSIGNLPYIQSFKSTETTIKAGKSEKIGLEVDADKFVGVKAIVASYTTSSGETYENPIAEDWVNSVQLGKNRVLD
ncbi:MAG: hypothetical protein IJJ40_06660 [Clostridia bacterium]|nr:hypothetical protein [Clostridia bacterium]